MTESQKAKKWWNDLPIQDIYGDNGWANLTMVHFPERGDCYGFTDEEIVYIYKQEHKYEN